MGWGGRPPSLFTRTQAAISSSNLLPRFISAGPARFPAAASCHHFLPEARPSRNTHAAHRLCVWEPTPQPCTWRGAREPRGAVRGSRPRIPMLLPQRARPASSHCSEEMQRSQKGQGRDYLGNLRPSPVEEPEPRQDQHTLLAHSWPPLPQTAAPTLPRAPGVSGSCATSPGLVGHSARIPEVCGLGTQNTPKAESTPAPARNPRAVRRVVVTPEQGHLLPLLGWVRGASWKSGVSAETCRLRRWEPGTPAHGWGVSGKKKGRCEDPG